MRRTRNVIGEIGPADAPRVYMAGGHLDSVVAGPGLNDNGSGVAAGLEVAEQLASRPLAGGAAFRVGFWAAEEIGLVGSRRYVDRLSRAERRRIKAYVNLDMVGSPGDAKAAVYAGDGADGRAIEAALRKGLPPGAPEERLGGASDHASFQRAGIEVGGVFTGASERVSAEAARRFGARAGRPADPCYHRACDRLANVDRAMLERVADAVEAALRSLAR